MKIEIGELEVNNSISPKNFLIIGFFALIFCIFMCYSWISEFIKSREYIECNATVVEYNWTNDGSDGTSYYIILQYEYNNRYYTYRQATNEMFHKSAGDEVKVLVNPKNPSEILNMYNQKIFIFFSLVTFVVSIVCFKGYRVRKRSESPNMEELK